MTLTDRALAHAERCERTIADLCDADHEAVLNGRGVAMPARGRYVVSVADVEDLAEQVAWIREVAS